MEPDISFEQNFKFRPKQLVVRRYFSLLDTKYEEPHLAASIAIYIREDVVQTITIHQIVPNHLYAQEAIRVKTLKEIKTPPSITITKFMFEPQSNNELFQHSILFPKVANWKKSWIDVCSGAKRDSDT